MSRNGAHTQSVGTARYLSDTGTDSSQSHRWGRTAKAVRDIRRDDWLRRLGSLPWMAQPGERWLYHVSCDVHPRDEIFHTPGRFGWDGGVGTSAYGDPAEGIIGILLTQRLLDSPESPNMFNDFWTLAYAAKD